MKKYSFRFICRGQINPVIIWAHCLCLIFCCAGALQAQDLPPIQNFTPRQYDAENQNWAITQGEDHWIYAANNGGLLGFNGIRWKRYTVPNGSILRSVYALGDRIYGGSYMEFGYWEAAEDGSKYYKSLSSGIQDSLLTDEEFWRIDAYADWVLFQSLERIYAYHVVEESFTIIEAPAPRAQSFNYRGDLFFRKAGEGLIQLQNGREVVRVPESDLEGKTVLGMVELSGTPALVLDNGSFLSLEDSNEAVWNPPGLIEYPAVKVYSSYQRKNGDIVLGTISDGLMVLNQQGDLLMKIGKVQGLNNNTVLGLYEDRESNLWLALDNGISVINSSSAFSEYNDRDGTIGVVYDAVEYQGELYLGTNQGLFRSTSSNGSSFDLVPGTEGQVWSLNVFDDQLLCGHNNGTFVMDGSRSWWANTGSGSWDIKPVPGNDSLLMVGGYQGLNILEKTPSGWRFRNSLADFRVSSRFFEFTSTTQLIVNHEYKGIYQLDLSEDYREVVVLEQTPPYGYGGSLLRLADKLYYANSSGIFSFEAESRSFEPDTTLINALYTGADVPYGVLVAQDNPERIWGLGKRTIFTLMPDALGDSWNAQFIDVPEEFRRRLGVAGFECIVPLQDGRHLIGKTDGYLLLDLNRITNTSPEVQIDGITHKDFNNQPIAVLEMNTLGELPPKNANISFTYGAPVYGKYLEVRFRTWLEGFQEDWGLWSTATSANYNNLPYGDYTFHVQARIGADYSEEPVSYSFSVLRPWYLSAWAIALFAIGGLGLVYFIHLRYRAYYRKQQRLLEAKSIKKLKRKELKAKQEIVEIKNRHLQQEIEGKNRELAVSTMSLIRKNEFLSRIKEQLRQASSASEVNEVVRLIDRNINSGEDWEFFESAFNNADKDFLKNIRERHTELSPNDLKLCAYLRLNLSSKEIAPLLNISVRSVEVKRYRLRKKMNLEHEQGLTDYILRL